MRANFTWTQAFPNRLSTWRKAQLLRAKKAGNRIGARRISANQAEPARVAGWRAPCDGRSMTPSTPHANERDTVVIIGGKDSLQAHYRAAVEKNGYQLRSYETRVPTKCGPAASKIALVIVMVTMVSHPLMMRARALAGEQGRIVYLKSPSITSLRATVEAVACDRGPTNSREPRHNFRA